MSSPTLQSIEPWIEKIALELLFAGPGRDEGLLPINSLLSDIEAALAATPPPDPIPAVVARARACVESSLDAGGFTPVALEGLNAWCDWMRRSLAALRGSQDLPAVPPLLASNPAAPASPAGGEAPTTPPPTDTPRPQAASPEDEEVLRLDPQRDGDLLREFVAESEEHLHNIEQGVLILEKSPADADTLNSIFRSFHTFKGGSGFLNLHPIHRLAHDLESLLDSARQGRLVISGVVIDIILQGEDRLRRFIDEIRIRLDGSRAQEPIRIPTVDLLGRIRSTLAARDDASSGTRPASPPSADPQPFAPAAPPPPSSSGSGRPAQRAGSGFVKVDTQKLDGLVDLVGELVIAQSLVSQNPELRAAATGQLSRHLAQLGRLTADLQRTAMSLRMVPIRATFEKMKRLVRDLALKESKQVELQFSGEETELDRNLIEKLDDPLVHMIRNAVDHGIESPEARAAAGKPAVGSIHLRAFHRGGNILIEIRDDGAGLHRDRILAKARRQGLVADGPPPPDNVVFGLIFAPGFSTAEKIAEISGRGVGLDVVQRNITGLRGKIEIDSTPGQGCAFTLFLPLTLAIIDGLIVGVGDQRFILPTLSVRESFRPTAEMITTVQNRGELVSVRGRQCPLLRLSRHLGIPARSEDPAESIVIVLESDRNTRCILVDQLIGKQEVVIESLGDTFKASYAVAGAAILGDGRVGLILDVNRLLHPQSTGSGLSPNTAHRPLNPESPRTTAATPTALAASVP